MVCASDRNLHVKAQRPTFRSIFESESSYVCHVVRRFGVPDRDVEDVAHDVFVTVYRRLDDFDPRLPLKPWLFGIAYRVAAAYRRRKANSEIVVDRLPDKADNVPSADERLVAEQRRRLVLRALEALEPDRRAVFLLHDIDGVTIPEVAAGLEIPLNTAYSRLRLARADFTVALRRLVAQGGEP